MALGGKSGRASESSDAESAIFEWQWQAHLHHAAQSMSGSVNGVQDDREESSRPALDLSVGELTAQVPVRPWESFFEERRFWSTEGDAGYAFTLREADAAVDGSAALAFRYKSHADRNLRHPVEGHGPVDSARPWQHFFDND